AVPVQAARLLQREHGLLRLAAERAVDGRDEVAQVLEPLLQGGHPLARRAVREVVGLLRLVLRVVALAVVLRVRLRVVAPAVSLAVALRVVALVAGLVVGLVAGLVVALAGTTGRRVVARLPGPCVAVRLVLTRVVPRRRLRLLRPAVRR